MREKKESTKLTQAILEQFNHLNTEDPFTESSKSRKSSITESSNSRKSSIAESSKSRKSSITETSKSRKSSKTEPSKSRRSSYTASISRRESNSSLILSNSNSSSRRASIVLNVAIADKLKKIERRKSLTQIQKNRIFQPKEEEKLLLEYRKCGRRPSSFF